MGGELDFIDEILDSNFKEASGQVGSFINRVRSGILENKTSKLFLLLGKTYGQLPPPLKKNYEPAYTGYKQDLEFLLEAGELRGYLKGERKPIKSYYKDFLEKRIWEAYQKLPLEKQRAYDRMYEGLKREIEKIPLDKVKKKGGYSGGTK